MAECGNRVGKGVVTYPCTLEPGHEGPHAADENPASQRERQRWLKDLTPAAEPERPSAPIFCPPCERGEHRTCDNIAADITMAQVFCACFKEDPNKHFGVEEERVIEVPCQPCDGQGVLAGRPLTAFEIAMGQKPQDVPCPACHGKRILVVPLCSAQFPDAYGNGPRCILPEGHEGSHDTGATPAMPPVLGERPTLDSGGIMHAPTKQRPGDQPLPEKNALPWVQHAVIGDIEERIKVGVERYGTPLQAFNGRNADLDLYEELIDGAMYAKQRLMERAEMAKQFEVVDAFVREGGLGLPAEIDFALDVLRKGLAGT